MQQRFIRDDILPAVIRPGMYAGDQRGRSEGEWISDAVAAFLNGRNEQHVQMPTKG